MAYIDSKVKWLIEQRVDNSFGLSISEIAPRVVNYGRFKHWLNSNISNITSVLEIVESEGVSPAFFAIYEINEGYNASYGWLNHTYALQDPYQDAREVAKWIKNGSNYPYYKPAWVDVGTNNLDFVPLDVQVYGNAYYGLLPLGTIGKLYIAGTAAATWEVFYPQGLLKEYNGVMDYGSPLNNMVQTLENWGVDIGSGQIDIGDDIINKRNDFIFVARRR